MPRGARTLRISRMLQSVSTCIFLFAAIHAQQVSFADISPSEDDALQRDAPYIFNSVNSLLRQWGNTLAPNGFSFTVATIPAGTTLYHGRKDANDPPSPEWFAFDAEMSYAIMGGRGGTTFLRTYRTTRALGPLLYLDGLSAALTTSGTLDGQNILIDGYVDDRGSFNDYTRAQRLCAEVAPLIGVEGFVRMNAGFELIWCDWSTGVELVLNNNVTHWAPIFNASQPGGFPPPPDSPEWNRTRRPWETDNGVDGLFAAHQAVLDDPEPEFPPPPDFPPGHPPGRRPPGRPPHDGGGGWRRSPFVEYLNWEWLRSATAVYDGAGEMRLQLIPSSFVSAYGRTGLNLSSSDPTQHRLTNASLAQVEALRIQSDVATAVADVLVGHISDTDWRGVTDQVVNRYGRRLPELHALLRNGTEDAVQQARFSLASLLMPFFQPTQSRATNVDTCSRAFVYGLDSLSHRENKILQAVLLVQRDICDVLLTMRDDFFSATGSESHLPQVPADTLELHAENLLQLMSRLRWHMWVQCDEHCSYAEVCYIEIWPLRLGGRPGPPGRDRSEVKPICAGYVDK
ncbi:hypothetical protein BKA62DRAFT_669447 [Auriculariales sp. MPI-PUGE-AT-0066]|nr:hypothetical protein BKA62DRAFT_669447 [Auriculariales sp. MPI-PUGE-AT-0066]